LELLSVTPNGEQANGDSAYPALSADGKVLIFATRATNLVPAASAGHWQLVALTLADGS
jgi:hypothetical protein